MKSTKLSILKLLTFFMIFGSSLYGSEYTWLHDYDEALELAKKENKDIYLFIGADICKFCKRYKETTLSDDAVMKRLTKDYIPVYLSRDQHLIPDHFPTTGVPRHNFVRSDESVYFSTQGFLEIAGFYTMLDEAELSKE